MAATHHTAFEASPLKVGTTSLDCYILANRKYVLSKPDVQKALNYDGKSENWISDFLKNLSKYTPIPDYLIAAFENPIVLTDKISAAKKETALAVVEAHLFIDTCHLLVKAKKEGYLNVNQLKHAGPAIKILNYLENKNIYDLIDLATGFALYKENVKMQAMRYLNIQLNDDSLLWIITFPDTLFEKLFELYSLAWPNIHKNIEYLSQLLLDDIYTRMPTVLLKKLRNEKPKRNYQKANKAKKTSRHPDLDTFINAILMVMDTSAGNKNIYLQLLNRSYPKMEPFDNKNIRFSKEKDNEAQQQSVFDDFLKKGIAHIKICKKHKNSNRE